MTAVLYSSFSRNNKNSSTCCLSG